MGESEGVYARRVLRLEQSIHMVAVGVDIRHVLDQRARRATDRSYLVEKEDIAVPGQG